MKLKDILNEMAMKPTLESEFTKIVKKLQKPYQTAREESIIDTIESTKSNLEGKKYYDVFGNYSRYGRSKFAYFSLFSGYVYGRERVVTSPGKGYDILKMKPKSEWMPAVKKLAEESVKDFYDSFIAKNTAKFSNVIKGKEISNISHNIRPASLTGNVIVECEDGSGFRASFNIEMSVSVKGKVFNRYPTRFHDVKLSDGTTMKSPSEAKMKKQF